MSKIFDFNKDRTALVIVDMQNDFVRRDAPMRVDEAYESIPVNQRLLAFAREKGMPVIFTKFVSGEIPSLLWNWSPEIESSHSCARNYERYYPDIGRSEQCADIIDELKPIMPGDYVIEKYHYSSFRNTGLTDILRSEGADTIAVTGTVTQICIACTIFDGFAEGFKAIAISDAVSTWDPLQQRATLENISNKFGMVMSAEEFMNRLQD